MSPLHVPAIPRRRRVTRRQLQPDAIRLFYLSRLRVLIAKAHALVTTELLPLVHEIRSDDLKAVREARIDTLEGDKERLRAKARELAKRFARDITPNKLKPLAAQVAHRTATFQKAQLQAQIKDVLSVAPFIRDEGLTAAAARFTTENIALIKSVPQRYLQEIESMVIGNVQEGTRATTIAQQIEERYGVAESNALRIANDQVGKFYGELNRSRQTELGIRGYVWTGAKDTRERPNHKALEGQAFTWSEAPEGGGTDDDEAGHPGSGINCRCQALPDVQGYLEGL